MGDTVHSTSLDWALEHLLKYGDSDLLPVPFEYRVIKSQWKDLLPILTASDLAAFSPAAHEHFMVPKPEGAFRVATRLDPLDALLYTAAVGEIAESIETARAPKNVACAYRIELSKDGGLFANARGWGVWNETSLALASRWGTKYVATADISDFYSQVGHHRVCNALELAGVPSERSHSIEAVLGHWSAKQSRGLPVGPHASIILAEACLTDVDQHLKNEGWAHTRYVDDFRIFCASYGDAQRAVHDLAQYLFTAHRLALQPNKTRIRKVETFIENVLESDRVEVDEKANKTADALRQFMIDNGPSLVQIDDAVDAQINLFAISDLFDDCIKQRPLRLGRARFLLRRAAHLGTKRLIDPVLENLDLLVPALRDALLYLKKVRRPDTAEKIAAALIDFAVDSDWTFLPMVQEWVVELITNSFAIDCSPEQIARLTKSAGAKMGLRADALLARATNNVPWVRAQKESWRKRGPWEQRAIIYSGSVLPQDERSAWKKAVLATHDPLNRAVAVFALK